jgi:hypothetical protein
VRPSRDLRKLVGTANRRLGQLVMRVSSCSAPPSKEDERTIALATIDLFNLWGLFARHFFISSAIGSRRVGGGHTRALVRKFLDSADVVDFSVLHLDPRRRPRRKGGWGPHEEPPWFQPGVLLKLCSAARISNEAQVVLALSVKARSMEDLPVARNFFAHRSELTASGVRRMASKYTLSHSLKPAVLLGSRPPGRPDTVLASWLAEIRYVVNLLPI